jgi:hypothetical protein
MRFSDVRGVDRGTEGGVDAGDEPCVDAGDEPCVDVGDEPCVDVGDNRDNEDAGEIDADVDGCDVDD